MMKWLMVKGRKWILSAGLFCVGLAGLPSLGYAAVPLTADDFLPIVQAPEEQRAELSAVRQPESVKVEADFSRRKELPGPLWP